ncbi:hypothetical protein LTS18_006096, partial [Coniosporium uncinatum]
MPQPGLLLAFSSPTDPSVTQDAYNKWYTDIHIGDVVDSGLADLAIRYKNLNPDARYQYLAIYRTPDLALLGDPETMKKVPTRHELFGGKDWTEVVDQRMRVWTQIQSFEGQGDGE